MKLESEQVWLFDWLVMWMWYWGVGMCVLRLQSKHKYEMGYGFVRGARKRVNKNASKANETK